MLATTPAGGRLVGADGCLAYSLRLAVTCSARFLGIQRRLAPSKPCCRTSNMARLAFPVSRLNTRRSSLTSTTNIRDTRRLGPSNTVTSRRLGRGSSLAAGSNQDMPISSNRCSSTCSTSRRHWRTRRTHRCQRCRRLCPQRTSCQGPQASRLRRLCHPGCRRSRPGPHRSSPSRN